MLEAFVSGITILSAGRTLYDWVTGHTVPQRMDRIEENLDRISGQIQRLDQRLYYRADQEVWDSALSEQRTVEDIGQLTLAARPVQESIGTDLIVSTPITSPQRLQTAFQLNPEELLFGIRPLEAESLREAHESDPTMVPVVFTRWERQFVGLMKVAYARDYLDLEYRPLGGLFLPMAQPGRPQQAAKSSSPLLHQRADVKRTPDVVVEHRDMASHTRFLLLTAGFYFYYWFYSTLTELHVANGTPMEPDMSRSNKTEKARSVSPRLWTLLTLFPGLGAFALWHYLCEYATFMGMTRTRPFIVAAYSLLGTLGLIMLSVRVQRNLNSAVKNRRETSG